MRKTLILAVTLLVLGIGIGYCVGKCKTSSTSTTMPSGMHMMSDGTMMADKGMTMSEMMMDMNAALRGKKGAELETAFLDEMIVHHQGAVEMAEILLQGTQRPELVKLGNEIITAQTAEIEMMKAWRKQWFVK